MKTVESRRDFFVNVARWLAGCLLAVASLVLWGRSVRNSAGETCGRRGICAGCERVSGCVLPQALSARRAGEAAGSPKSGW